MMFQLMGRKCSSEPQRVCSSMSKTIDDESSASNYMKKRKQPGSPIVAKSNIETRKDLNQNDYIPEKKIKVSKTKIGEHNLAICHPENRRVSTSKGNDSHSTSRGSASCSTSRGSASCSTSRGSASCSTSRGIASRFTPVRFDDDPEFTRIAMECATLLNELKGMPIPTYMIAAEALKERFTCANFIVMSWSHKYKWLRYITKNPEERLMYDQWMRVNHPEEEIDS